MLARAQKCKHCIILSAVVPALWSSELICILNLIAAPHHPIPNAKFKPITIQKELCLIIIKVPKAPLHHVPRCYGPL